MQIIVIDLGFLIAIIAESDQTKASLNAQFKNIQVSVG